MEIPSMLYIQALAERIDLLTSYISNLDAYQWLTGTTIKQFGV